MPLNLRFSFVDELFKRDPVTSTTIDASEQRNNVRGLDVIDDVIAREETSVGADDSSTSTHTYTEINESGDIVYYNDPPLKNPYTELNVRRFTGEGITAEEERGRGGGREGGGGVRGGESGDGAGGRACVYIACIYIDIEMVLEILI